MRFPSTNLHTIKYFEYFEYFEVQDSKNLRVQTVEELLGLLGSSYNEQSNHVHGKEGYGKTKYANEDRKNKVTSG